MCRAETETVNHILFECPPAVQCWVLSDIPTSPGYFLYSSLYVNIEILLKFSKDSNQLGVVSGVFPWIMWYQWKARNNKCFNNKDISPMETLQLACQEAEAWKMAQITETTFSAEENFQEAAPTSKVTTSSHWRCQVDASWVETSDGIGMGLIVLEQEREVLRGQSKGSQVDSPVPTPCGNRRAVLGNEGSSKTRHNRGDLRVGLPAAGAHSPAEETLASSRTCFG